MKTKAFLLTTLLVAACTNENDMLTGHADSRSSNQSDSVVILQERNQNLPTEWSRKVAHTRSARSFTPLEDYVGYAYNIGNSFLGDYENITFPVIDLTKLRDNFPSAVSGQNIGETTITKNVYTDYDKYVQNSNITKKVTSGFSLNLGLFKLGRKKTHTETFINNEISESKKVYGELSIEFKHGKYTLNTTNVVMKKIASECLDEVFLMSLYLTPMSQILNDYGPLVVTGYYTGGRASALYEGESEYKYDYERIAKDMDAQIDATYSWGKNNASTSTLEFGNNKGEVVEESNENKVSSLSTYLHTIGGLAAVETGGGQNIEEVDLNLTPWLQSLADQDTHVMIGIQDEGLIGLSEFVLEENFKRRIQDTHMGFTSNIELTEPFIEIVKVFVRNSQTGEKLYEVAPVLNTRQGDQIILNDGKASEATDEELRANNDYDTFMAKSQAIAEEKAKYYQCEIKANSNKTLNPIVRIPFNMSLPGLNEGNMYKFRNEATSMCYIYDSKKRYAFAYYDVDSFIPDAYGISEWVETIPEKSLSMTALAQFYKVIGL